MKQLLIIILCTAFAYAAVAQELYDTTRTKNRSELTTAAYFKKARNQKTTAIIIGASGLAVGTIGMFTGLKGFAKDWDSDPEHNGDSQYNTGTALMIIGGAMLVTAIPFEIAGKHNEKKATLMLGTQNTFQLQMKKTFAIGVAINF